MKVTQLLLAIMCSTVLVFGQNEKEFDLSEYLKNNYEMRLQRINTFFANGGNLDRELNAENALYDIVDGKPIFIGINNRYSARTLNAQNLYDGGSAGLDLSGAGLYVGVFDGGKIRTTHQELTGRVITNLPHDFQFHATHVAGTIMAAGVEANAKGIAYGTNVLGYAFVSPTGGALDEISIMNAEASGQYQMKISNHSYGLIASSIPQYYFGAYTANSKDIDLVANAHPNYLIVVAAGNDRDNTTVPQVQQKAGYDLLSGMATAKNGMTVGAVNQVLNYSGPTSVVMSGFSNWGPTDDGRIKPDCVAKGVSVYSTLASSDAAYGYQQGTSMATPAISGLCALLQEHYNNVNQSYMLSNSLKGVILHAAREAGATPGPDYRFGWGLPDAVASAQIISQAGTESAILEENTLNQGDTYTTSITAMGTEPLKVSICWNDPAGFTSSAVVDDPNPVLRNDLDVSVEKDGIIYYPWKLNKDVPTAGATNTETNDVDNFERVDIENPSGVYNITVSHKDNLVGGSQVYSLIVSGGGILGTEDIEGVRNEFEIYPNPVSDFLIMKSNENFSGLNVSVYNVTGQMVIQDQIDGNNSLNVSHLQSGNYIIVIQKDNEKLVKKFIKK